MRCASALLALSFACSGGGARSRVEAGAPKEARHDASLEPRSEQRAPAWPRPPRHAEVRELQGVAHRSGERLLAGARLGSDDELTLERGSTMTVALEEHVQLRLRGPLRARMLPEGEPALLLREGALSVDCAPRAARSTESAFWLATPDARIDVVESARMVVDVRKRRASEIAMVSGYARLSQGAEPSVLAAAGELRCVGHDVRPGHRELARAEAALSSSPGCKARAGAVDLDSVLTEIEREAARERELVANHRAALSDADAALAQRQELARLARSRVLTHERARALRARLEAELADPDPAQRAQLARARALAPYRF